MDWGLWKGSNTHTERWTSRVKLLSNPIFPLLAGSEVCLSDIAEKNREEDVGGGGEGEEEMSRLSRESVRSRDKALRKITFLCLPVYAALSIATKCVCVCLEAWWSGLADSRQPETALLLQTHSGTHVPSAEISFSRAVLYYL